MKTKELRALSEKDLNAKIEELKKELIKDNAQVAVGTNPKSPAKIRNQKKNISRILTILKEKQQEADNKK
jgi:large subunit ribosomal protein L29